MKSPKVFLSFMFLLLLVPACGYSPREVQTGTPATKKFTTADVAKLRWLEGTWRGSGVDQAPFFERYRLENETTLAVDGFPDEKLEKVDDTSRFELKDGQFGSSYYVASAIDDTSIDFIPIPGKDTHRLRELPRFAEARRCHP